jgi:microcin C transport system permease protein
MTVGYLVKRLLLIIPTRLGIILVTFVLIQFAPGGPVEHILARMRAQGLGSDHSDTGLHPTNDAR